MRYRSHRLDRRQFVEQASESQVEISPDEADYLEVFLQHTSFFEALDAVDVMSMEPGDIETAIQEERRFLAAQGLEVPPIRESRVDLAMFFYQGSLRSLSQFVGRLAVAAETTFDPDEVARLAHAARRSYSSVRSARERVVDLSRRPFPHARPEVAGLLKILEANQDFFRKATEDLENMQLEQIRAALQQEMEWLREAGIDIPSRTSEPNR